MTGHNHAADAVSCEGAPRATTATAAVPRAPSLTEGIGGDHAQTSLSSSESVRIDHIYWRLGTPRPDRLGPNIFLSALVPRPTAWVCVNGDPEEEHMDAYDDDDDNAGDNDDDGGGNAEQQRRSEPLVSLLEGYSGASDRPPTIMLSSAALPPKVMKRLRQDELCSVSVATEREAHAAFRASAAAAAGNEDCKDELCGPACTFSQLGLDPYDAPPHPTALADSAARRRRRRPPAVASSPIHMHCRLSQLVPLPNGQFMTLLHIETFVVRGSVLMKQQVSNQRTVAPVSVRGNPDVRRITAKIQVELIRPLGSLGGGRFGVLDGIHHMVRPVPRAAGTVERGEGGGIVSEKGVPAAAHTASGAGRASMEAKAAWIVEEIRRAPPPKTALSPSRDVALVEGNGDDVIYNYSTDHHCSLGYNPMKQSVIPRFIGWISSYADRTRIPHLSPYSFFAEVGRGTRPMVAFAACPRVRGTSDWKDAHRDAEEVGCFAVNVVSEDLADAMNYTAAPLARSESEFALASLEFDDARTVDAPLVDASPISLECRYVRTVKVPEVRGGDSDYFLIVGEVVGMRISKDVLGDDGLVDVGRLRPLARLGYGQEYAVIHKCISKC